MTMYSFVSEQSRKSHSVKNMYEYLKGRVNRGLWDKNTSWDSISGTDGIPVPEKDRHKIINLRLHDEHLSPYFKTSMNLFHMLMVDETAEIYLYKSNNGWLFTFDGVPQEPQPFGQSGYDMR